MERGNRARVRGSRHGRRRRGDHRRQRDRRYACAHQCLNVKLRASATLLPELSTALALTVAGSFATRASFFFAAFVNLTFTTPGVPASSVFSPKATVALLRC